MLECVPFEQFRLNLRHVPVGQHRAHSCVVFDTPFPPYIQ